MLDAMVTRYVPVHLVDPGPNDRAVFDDAKLRELADSIAAEGLLQPPVLRPRPGGRFEIAAGERRTRAVRLLGWETMPAVVREMDDETAAAIMLAENVQRADLSPIEEAQAYRSRMDRFGWSVAECARRANVSDSKVRGRLRLLELGPAVQRAIAANDIPLAFAEVMESLDANRQLIALRWIASRPTTPTRNQFWAYAEMLRRQQYAEMEVPLFSLESLSEAVEAEANRPGALLHEMLPRLPGMPDVRWAPGAATAGHVIDFYIRDLLAGGNEYEARVLADFWAKAQAVNTARISPLDSSILRDFPAFAEFPVVN